MDLKMFDPSKWKSNERKRDYSYGTHFTQPQTLRPDRGWYDYSPDLAADSRTHQESTGARTEIPKAPHHLINQYSRGGSWERGTGSILGDPPGVFGQSQQEVFDYSKPSEEYHFGSSHDQVQIPGFEQPHNPVKEALLKKRETNSILEQAKEEGRQYVQQRYPEDRGFPAATFTSEYESYGGQDQDFRKQRDFRNSQQREMERQNLGDSFNRRNSGENFNRGNSGDNFNRGNSGDNFNRGNYQPNTGNQDFRSYDTMTDEYSRELQEYKKIKEREKFNYNPSKPYKSPPKKHHHKNNRGILKTVTTVTTIPDSPNKNEKIGIQLEVDKAKSEKDENESRKSEVSSPNWEYCDVCDMKIQGNSEMAYRNHCRGIVHLQKMVDRMVDEKKGIATDKTSKSSSSKPAESPRRTDPPKSAESPRHSVANKQTESPRGAVISKPGDSPRQSRSPRVTESSSHSSKPGESPKQVGSSKPTAPNKQDSQTRMPELNKRNDQSNTSESSKHDSSKPADSPRGGMSSKSDANRHTSSKSGDSSKHGTSSKPDTSKHGDPSKKGWVKTGPSKKPDRPVIKASNCFTKDNYCRVCQVTFTDKWRHIQSEKHGQTFYLYLSQGLIDSEVPELEKKVERRKHDTHEQTGFICQVCQILMFGYKNYIGHINGRKHAKLYETRKRLNNVFDPAAKLEVAAELLHDDRSPGGSTSDSFKREHKQEGSKGIPSMQIPQGFPDDSRSSKPTRWSSGPPGSNTQEVRFLNQPNQQMVPIQPGPQQQGPVFRQVAPPGIAVIQPAFQGQMPAMQRQQWPQGLPPQQQQQINQMQQMQQMHQQQLQNIRQQHWQLQQQMQQQQISPQQMQQQMQQLQQMSQQVQAPGPQQMQFGNVRPQMQPNPQQLQEGPLLQVAQQKLLEMIPQQIQTLIQQQVDYQTKHQQEELMKLKQDLAQTAQLATEQSEKLAQQDAEKKAEKERKERARRSVSRERRERRGRSRERREKSRERIVGGREPFRSRSRERERGREHDRSRGRERNPDQNRGRGRDDSGAGKRAFSDTDPFFLKWFYTQHDQEYRRPENMSEGQYITWYGSLQTRFDDFMSQYNKYAEINPGVTLDKYCILTRPEVPLDPARVHQDVVETLEPVYPYFDETYEQYRVNYPDSTYEWYHRLYVNKYKKEPPGDHMPPGDNSSSRIPSGNNRDDFPYYRETYEDFESRFSGVDFEVYARLYRQCHSTRFRNRAIADSKRDGVDYLEPPPKLQLGNNRDGFPIYRENYVEFSRRFPTMSYEKYAKLYREVHRTRYRAKAEADSKRDGIDYLEPEEWPARKNNTGNDQSSGNRHDQSAGSRRSRSSADRRGKQDGPNTRFGSPPRKRSRSMDRQAAYNKGSGPSSDNVHVGPVLAPDMHGNMPGPNMGTGVGQIPGGVPMEMQEAINALSAGGQLDPSMMQNVLNMASSFAQSGTNVLEQLQHLLSTPGGSTLAGLIQTLVNTNPEVIQRVAMGDPQAISMLTHQLDPNILQQLNSMGTLMGPASQGLPEPQGPLPPNIVTHPGPQGDNQEQRLSRAARRRERRKRNHNNRNHNP